MSASLEARLPFISVEFTQEAASGPVKIPGLKVGDILIALNYLGRDDGHALQGHGWFEGVVTTDDELQQRASTTMPADFRALFVRLPDKVETSDDVEPASKPDPIFLPAESHTEIPLEHADEHLSEGEPK